jgi:hypothetical protein
MFGINGLDLDRRHGFASRQNDVFRAVDDGDPAVLVHHPDIAGEAPVKAFRIVCARPPGDGGGFRVSVIAQRGVEIAHRDMTGRTARHHAVVIVQDQHPRIDMGRADTVRILQKFAGALRCHVQAFTQPRRGHDVGLRKHLGEFAAQRRGRWCGRGHHRARAGQGCAVPGVVYRVDQGRHQRQVLDIPRADFGQVAHRIERR